MRRAIMIDAVDNGTIVRVGCLVLVFQGEQGKAEMLNELSRYISDPDAVEKEYVAKYRKDSSLQKTLGTI